MRLILTWIITSLVASGASLCEPSAAIRTALKSFEIKDATGEQRRAMTRDVARELLTQHPTDYFVLDRFERTFHFEKPEVRDVAEKTLRQIAAQHPDNAAVALVSAKWLVDSNTPRAIELMKKSAHPWAHMALADIYSYGKFVDRAEARSHVDAFFTACPASLEPQALSRLQRQATPEMAGRYAPALRERLLREKDPDRLRGWETLWNLEFTARPPNQHAAVRKQIAEDLARIESMRVPETEEWLGFLAGGYAQANDPAGKARTQDRLIANFPKTWSARRVIRDRFQKDHPWPGPTDPEDKKQAFYKAQLAFADAHLRRQPDEFEYILLRFNSLAQLNGVKPEEVAAAGNAELAALRRGADWSALPPFEWHIARMFVKHKVELSQVPGLVDEGWKGIKSRESRPSDRDPADRDRSSQEFFLKTEAARILIDAGKELNRPDLARGAVEELQRAKLEKPNQRVTLQSLLARYAEAQGRKLDALLLYRAALEGRPAGVKQAKDEIAESIDRLYKELGGTDAARELWNARSRKVEIATEDGRWETPNRPMPAWELSDLAGKTWKLKSLEGKTLLINVWATWCGPCRSELPYLEKLYHRVKGRNDLAILSFNIDEEIGLVQPFIDEQKLTFPVLLGRSYVSELLPSISIPRNWIVDARGKWRAEQIGFGQDENWETAMLERLEKTRPE